MALSFADLKGRTMKYAQVGRTYVTFHGAVEPSKNDWNDWLADLEKNAPNLDGVFVFTGGGGPNALQRKQTINMWSRQARVPPIAVVFTNPVVRTMATAMNYFMSRPIRMFSPAEIDDALEKYLALSPADLSAVRALMPAALAWAGYARGAGVGGWRT
jgi:hypothetical protein